MVTPHCVAFECEDKRIIPRDAGGLLWPLLPSWNPPFGKRGGRLIGPAAGQLNHENETFPADAIVRNNLNSTTTLSSGCLTVAGFCQWSGLGRTKVYDLIKQGELRPLKCGRRTLIPVEEAIRWRNSLPHLLPMAGQDIRGP